MRTYVILTDVADELGPRGFLFDGHEQVVLGRASDCDVRLPDSTVSRRHCLLDAGGDVVRVRDLESLNGTYVNGRRLGEKGKSGGQARRAFRELHDGDELRLGTRVFRVRLELVGTAEGEMAARTAEPGRCA